MLQQLGHHLSCVTWRGFQPQMLGSTVTLTSKSILILIFNGSTLYTYIYIYIYTYIYPHFFPHTPFYCASVFHGLGWQPARDRGVVPARVSKKGWGGRGGSTAGGSGLGVGLGILEWVYDGGVASSCKGHGVRQSARVGDSGSASR